MLFQAIVLSTAKRQTAVTRQTVKAALSRPREQSVIKFDNLSWACRQTMRHIFATAPRLAESEMCRGNWEIEQKRTFSRAFSLLRNTRNKDWGIFCTKMEALVSKRTLQTYFRPYVWDQTPRLSVTTSTSHLGGPVSYLGPETGYTNWRCHGISQSLQVNAWIEP
jgi:hypothetical protein